MAGRKKLFTVKTMLDASKPFQVDVFNTEGAAEAFVASQRAQGLWAYIVPTHKDDIGYTISIR
jgi:hypothetical protein